MLLNQIVIRDFKKIREIELDLADINILVGTNGSGKSSVLQAIHLACCVIRQTRGDGTIAAQQLDYLPSDSYRALGHKDRWGNKRNSPGSSLQFLFEDDEYSVSASCSLKSARTNSGISISSSIPRELSPLMKVQNGFFSAYSPGVSGISSREEKRSKKVVLRTCSYGDSNSVLRNVLDLLKDLDEENITHLENWIGQVVGKIKIHVSHNDEENLYISCWVEGADGHTVPLDLVGTGFLQLLQIFSYILLFEPQVLLIDEPDTHLHPTAQEQLVQILASIAKERNFRIIMSTHSPFIIRGAPANANVYWLDDGAVNSKDREQVELALGWGAFGKKILVYTEDEDITYFKKIISQWPEIEKYIAIVPGKGYKHIPQPHEVENINKTFNGMFKIFIYRDRDSLTKEEVSLLQDRYEKAGAILWFPEDSDIESYFCFPSL